MSTRCRRGYLTLKSFCCNPHCTLWGVQMSLKWKYAIAPLSLFLSLSLSLSLFVYVGTTLCFHESCCILLLSTQILGDCQRATSICDIPRRYESVPMECIHVIQANCFSSEHCFNWDASKNNVRLMWHILL